MRVDSSKFGFKTGKIYKCSLGGEKERKEKEKIVTPPNQQTNKQTNGPPPQKKNKQSTYNIWIRFISYTNSSLS